MARTYALATIVGTPSIEMNANLRPGVAFYKWNNPKECLSAVTTRRSEEPKQAAHGVRGSLSHYNPRFLNFDVEIHALTLDERVQMETDLVRAITLPTSQDYAVNDGYVLILIEGDDGNSKQIYAKLVDLDMSPLAERRPTMSRVRFSMVAEEDVFLYDQELTIAEGPESVDSTNFSFQDGNLPTFQDGDLPTIQDMTISALVVVNAGTQETDPLITIHGPTQSPILRNLTTGRTMDFGAAGGLTLLAGERVEIDVLNQSITKYDTDEVSSDASAYFDPSGNWIYIITGSNTLTLFDESPTVLTAGLEVEFRNAYLT